MSRHDPQPDRTPIRLIRSALLAALVVFLLGPIGIFHHDQGWEQPIRETSPAPAYQQAQPQLHREAEVADGAVSQSLTLFDDRFPAITRLHPELLDALRRAANDAQEDGIVLLVNSGWRSRKYQNHLLHEAIHRYGSEAEAARWVATPDTSPHVSGEAVDLGPSAATSWLSRHGAAYGLCQIYRNEPWHFELRREAIHQGCPPMYADPTHDPRMQ